MRSLKKYALKRLYRLKHLLRSVKFTDDVEVLHAIRVEIKKIKAILRLIEFSKKNFNAHHNFIPLRNIFRKAGVIREPLVFHQLLNRYTVESTIDELLLFPSLKPISGFRKNTTEYLKSVKKIKKVILLKIKNIGRQVVRNYLNKLKKKIEKRLYPIPDPSTLHTTRKVLKEFLYLSAIFERKRNSISPFFEECSERIGQWHDKQHIIQLLRERGLPVKELIQKLESECLQDLAHLHHQIENYYVIETTIAMKG